MATAVPNKCVMMLFASEKDLAPTGSLQKLTNCDTCKCKYSLFANKDRRAWCSHVSFGDDNNALIEVREVDQKGERQVSKNKDS